jgi:hypothetical protein
VAQYSDPGTLEFDAVIKRADVSGSSAFVEFPFEVRELFGVKGRVPVFATFDGADYQGSLVTYGGPRHLILVLAEIQQRIAKSPGDTVRVTVRLDSSERIVELDDDIEQQLRDAGQFDAFRAMAYSHQREYVLWITSAKQSETRSRRISTMLEMVAEGQKLK